MNFLTMYNSLKRKLQTTITAVAERYAATSVGGIEDSRIKEINALIALNIPRTQKEKNSIFVWAHNIAKEFAV